MGSRRSVEEFVSSRQRVEFFYCSSCPWSYLAYVRLNEAVLRTGGTVRYRPVLAGQLHQDGNLPDPYVARHPAEANYQRKDLQDWASFAGVKIKLPDGRRAPPVWAQRAAVVALDTGHASKLIGALFAAHFASGRDIADRTEVISIAADCGLHGPHFEAALDDSKSTAVVVANTEELLARGGFGSPTMFLGDDMYFGNDRMPLVESALMRAADHQFIAPGEHGRI